MNAEITTGTNAAKSMMRPRIGIAITELKKTAPKRKHANASNGTPRAFARRWSSCSRIVIILSAQRLLSRSYTAHPDVAVFSAGVLSIAVLSLVVKSSSLCSACSIWRSIAPKMLQLHREILDASNPGLGGCRYHCLAEFAAERDVVRVGSLLRAPRQRSGHRFRARRAGRFARRVPENFEVGSGECWHCRSRCSLLS